jgi:acetyltransferase-like isoleucine patch superfamily enzyme
MSFQATQLARWTRKSLVGLWLSRQATQPVWQLPIVGNTRSRVICRRGSRLEVHGRLRMGDMTTHVGYVARGRAPVIELQPNATLTFLGDGALGDGARILLGTGANVRIGKDTYFDGDSRLLCAERISIGHSCAIAWGVLIMDANFHSIDDSPPDAPVTIGDHVWVGAQATILKGVTVGDGAVIGAGALVTRDVPAGALAVGNPARVVREGVRWD